MTATLEQLCDGILRLGQEDEELFPRSEVPFDVWKELQETRPRRTWSEGRARADGQRPESLHRTGIRHRHAGI